MNIKEPSPVEKGSTSKLSSLDLILELSSLTTSSPQIVLILICNVWNKRTANVECDIGWLPEVIENDRHLQKGEWQ